MAEFKVRRRRLEKANMEIARLTSEMTDSEFMEFLDYVGWFDLFRYGENGEPILELNNLQLIGLAACLLAHENAQK